MNDRSYPTDERGKFDAAIEEAARPSKPCARRIDTLPVTWCMLPDHHGGQCSGPFPRLLEPSNFGPEASRRRRW